MDRMVSRKLEVVMSAPPRILCPDIRIRMDDYKMAYDVARAHARMVAEIAMVNAGCHHQSFSRASVSAVWNRAPMNLCVGEYRPNSPVHAYYALNAYLSGIQDAIMVPGEQIQINGPGIADVEWKAGGMGAMRQIGGVPLVLKSWKSHSRIVFAITGDVSPGGSGVQCLS